MALRDVLVKQDKATPITWLDSMRTQLESDDFAWLMECLNNRLDYSGVYIAAKMTKAGYPVSATTINNIRKTL